MRKVLVFGVCALFIACSGASENKNQADTIATSMADTNMVTASTTVDTTSVPAVVSQVTIPIKVEETKVAEVKAKESPVVKETKAVVKVPIVTDNGDVKRGEELISKSDCFACHKVNEKLLGPSYHDVANKYENTKANVEMLVNKIKAGGSGVWGAIPMSPHPALSDDDAKAMVHYVLSLK